MDLLIKNARVFTDHALTRTDLFISDGMIVAMGSALTPGADTLELQFDNAYVFPGLIDVHVHLREPGFSYKETIGSGTRAAAHGGFTTVCAMPNLNPIPDCMENLHLELEAIRSQAVVHVHPYGAITRGEAGKELAELEEMADKVCGFSDDGRGVQEDKMMRRAMERVKALDKIIAAHCEDDSLLSGGYIHDGIYARLHGHKGLSSASEWKQLERDLELVRETGCRYHACHISTKESVALLRRAKAEGLDVSAETAPHYLALHEMDLQEEGRFKMNPPLRSKEDQMALWRGSRTAPSTWVATDHAPHTKEEKGKGPLRKRYGCGRAGNRFSHPLHKIGYARGVISLEKLLDLMQGESCPPL